MISEAIVIGIAKKAAEKIVSYLYNKYKSNKDRQILLNEINNIIKENLREYGKETITKFEEILNSFINENLGAYVALSSQVDPDVLKNTIENALENHFKKYEKDLQEILYRVKRIDKGVETLKEGQKIIMEKLNALLMTHQGRPEEETHQKSYSVTTEPIREQKYQKGIALYIEGLPKGKTIPLNPPLILRPEREDK